MDHLSVQTLSSWVERKKEISDLDMFMLVYIVVGAAVIFI